MNSRKKIYSHKQFTFTENYYEIDFTENLRLLWCINFTENIKFLFITLYFLLFHTIIKIFENIGNYKDILLLIYLILSAKCSVAVWIVNSVADSKLLLQTLHKLLAEDLSEVVLLVEKFCSSMGSFLISLSLTTKSSFSILIWPTPEMKW